MTPFQQLARRAAAPTEPDTVAATAAAIIAAGARARGETPPAPDGLSEQLVAVGPKGLAAQIINAGKKRRGEIQ